MILLKIPNGAKFKYMLIISLLSIFSVLMLNNNLNPVKPNFITKNSSVLKEPISVVKHRVGFFLIGTGKYIWAKEDIANPDAVNINQIDIPISKGEKVEFYIVSVSEAGWPENPLLSQPSNTITIDFPSDLASEDEARIALDQSAQDNVRVQLENDLQSQGLDVHLSTSFN